jgi:hypothetical protein
MARSKQLPILSRRLNGAMPSNMAQKYLKSSKVTIIWRLLIFLCRKPCNRGSLLSQTRWQLGIVDSLGMGELAQQVVKCQVTCSLCGNRGHTIGVLSILVIRSLIELSAQQKEMAFTKQSEGKCSARFYDATCTFTCSMHHPGSPDLFISVIIVFAAATFSSTFTHFCFNTFCFYIGRLVTNHNCIACIAFGVTIAPKYDGLMLPIGNRPVHSLLWLHHLLYAICTALTQLLTQPSYVFLLS